MKKLLAVALCAVLVGITVTFADRPLSAQTCEFWVAPNGNDANPGTESNPWATLTHAAVAVPDTGCVVSFRSGVYVGNQEIDRRFATVTTFRSASSYGAVLEGDSTVVDFDGARNVVFEGFEVRHAGPGSTGNIINIDRKGDTDIWSEKVVIRDNVIHDSYDDDLLKVQNGVRFATIERNVFYNQGPSEQHLDINSVTDILVTGNILFNDFAASNRPNGGDTKHYIVIKDSNGAVDGQIGAERVTVRGNIFSGWQGGRESLIQVGNDGKPYYEAKDTKILDNLVLGTGPDEITAVLGIAGASGVTFTHNTVSGDLPASAYAFRAVVKGENPINRSLAIHNNIWSDPMGTMGAQPGEAKGDFSSGDPGSIVGLDIGTNLYWNGGAGLPSGDVASPSDDPTRVVGDPGLPVPDQPSTLPVWTGSRFRGGDLTITEAFNRIVASYGVPTSSLVSGGDPVWSTGTDMLGSPRGALPTLGAVERGAAGLDTRACPAGEITPAGFGDLIGFPLETVESVDCLAYYAITRGTAPGVFAPTDQVFRWQMALFLVRSLEAAGVPLPSGADQDFDDLRGLSSEAVLAVNRLGEMGVTTGTSPGVFAPTDEVFRWQMALFLVRSLEAAGVPLPSGADQDFDDLSGLSSEAVLAVNRLGEMGVATGIAPGVFDPGGVVPRWQMALFLTRWLDVADVTP